MGTVSPALSTLRAAFADPPREFGPMPFWFWNDDLDEGELLKQIRDFYAKGYGGFIPHARIGLSRRVGYLMPEYFRLMRLAVAEAARLGMKVVLYDEGSYPSGSAQGRVVAENPAYAARCLIPVDHPLRGPARGYWRPSPGRALQDDLACVVLAREIGPAVLDPASLTLLDPEGPGLVRYEVPEGNWRLVSCWSVYSGGTIRGVFDEEEDGHAQAPAAGDILNPEAVACFLRHTHEAYYAHLSEFFGSTIVAMFTDEPNPLGRAPKRGPSPQPYTAGLLDDLAHHWPPVAERAGREPRFAEPDTLDQTVASDAQAGFGLGQSENLLRWLPALWFDCGPRTAAFRRAYDRAVHDRLERVFYAAQSHWCAEHGIALTGHPAASDEMGALRQFQWPGQDMVWRYVEPGSPTALEGAHSVAPRGAASAAILGRCRRNVTEVLGAYSWRLTLDETKWLLDWHMVRGNNLVMPHACFYSLRGRRAYESEPDVGRYNVWWPYVGALNDYVRRVCWLLSDGEEFCEVGVLTDPEAMAWAAAKEMYRAQVGFVYLDDEALARATLGRDGLVAGSAKLRAVVCDPPGALSAGAREKLDRFEALGGLVLEKWDPPSLSARLAVALGKDVDWHGGPDLRALHYRKRGLDIFLLVNEGESAIEGELSLRGEGALDLWDPLEGGARPWPGLARNGRTHTVLRLERRQGLALVLDSLGRADGELPLPETPADVLMVLDGLWTATDMMGVSVEIPCLGDWALARRHETFAGTRCYHTEFAPTQISGDSLFLDLGRVGDIAEVLVNGQHCGVRAWAPHVLGIRRWCVLGRNELEVRVTNSMANVYEGMQRPSGLMGPVVLRGGAVAAMSLGKVGSVDAVPANHLQCARSVRDELTDHGGEP